MKRALILLCLGSCTAPQMASVPAGCNAIIIETKDRPHAHVLTMENGTGIILANRNVPQSEIDHECQHINGTIRHPVSAAPSYTDIWGERHEQYRTTDTYRGNGPTHGPFKGF